MSAEISRKTGRMSHAAEKAEQRSFISDEVPVAGESQLALPLVAESEAQPAPLPPAPRGKRRRKGSRGFVPVTHDPDVARSYSDNVALDYAIARGLAQALGSLPPEELASLRAKVAKAARHNVKTDSSSSNRS